MRVLCMNVLGGGNNSMDAPAQSALMGRPRVTNRAVLPKHDATRKIAQAGK